MTQPHLPTPPEWVDRALCAQVDVGELFYPETGGSAREAKAVCNGTADRDPCPVRELCLAHALANEERWGIWGGTSESERRRLRAGQAQRREQFPQPITHGTASGYRSHLRRGIPACEACLEGSRLGIKVGKR